MSNLDNYFVQMENSVTSGASITTSGSTGTYIDNGWWGICPPYEYPYFQAVPYYVSTPENKTERAFFILKILVKEKLIKEPTSFDQFVKIVEKIDKVI